MRFSNCKNYLIRIIIPVLFLFMIGSCFWEEPKKNKSSDVFVWLLLAYLSDPPYKICSNYLTGKEKTIEQGAIVKSGGTSYINDYYIINSPSRLPVTVKIELKSNCQVARSFEFCLNNRHGYASFSDSKNTVCSDNSIDSEIPIQGNSGISETCTLSYAAEAYYIHVYNYIAKDCYYEISYN
jgi:hypothetical protein